MPRTKQNSDQHRAARVETKQREKNTEHKVRELFMESKNVVVELNSLNLNENLTALLRAYNETKYVEGKAVEILYKAKKDKVTALVSITASSALLSLTYLRLDMLDKGMVSTGYIIGVCGLLLYANWTGRLLLDIQRTNRDLKRLQEDQAVLLELIKKFNPQDLV